MTAFQRRLASEASLRERLDQARGMPGRVLLRRALDDLTTSDYRGHAGAGATLDQLKESIGGFLEAFPDMKVVVRHVVAENDMASTWVTYAGTHEAPFAGVPGSGRAVEIAGWDLFRIADGVIKQITDDGRPEGNDGAEDQRQREI